MPFTLGQRQTLGPPAEMSFIPFPFEELAPGIGTMQSKDVGKFASPGKVEPKTGLLNVDAGGFDIPVSDQAILNSRTQQKDQEKQDIVNSIYQEPNNPLLYSQILKHKNIWQNEENYGDTARILRNKEQVDLFNKATSGKYNNPWTTIDAQEKQLAYALAQKEGKIIDLDLSTDLANLPKEELNRFQAIDNSLTGMSQSEIAGVADYLTGRNINILPTPEGNFLVNVEGKGYSKDRVVNTIASRIMASDFQDDIDKQLRYEELQADLSGHMFDRSVRYNQIVNQSIKNYAVNKKVGYDLTRSVEELTEPTDKGLFDSSLLKSTTKTIGTFDTKIPEINPDDKKFYDVSGKLNNDKINKSIADYTKAANAIRDAKYKDKESFREENRLRSEAEHLGSIIKRTLELRKSHKVISDLYTSDIQFTEAVKKAVNASDKYKYEATIPQLQILSQAMWDLASTNPQVWGLKDESTGEFLESIDIPEDKKPAFSIDPTTATGGFQLGKKFYSVQLPDPLVPVFGTVKNITAGIQTALNQDKIVKIQPFIDFGDEKVIKIGRVLEDGKYEIKIEYDPKVGYVDAQSYLSTYIESLSERVRKVGKDILKGTKL